MRILFLTIDLANNSTGRTFALWTLARRLGWATTVVAAAGDNIWPPLVGHPFAGDCRVIHAPPSSLPPDLVQLAKNSDLIVSVKPLVGSFDRGILLHNATGTPLIVDIDDPDLTVQLSTRNPLKAIAKMILRPRAYFRTLRLRSAVQDYPRFVSNPSLQGAYGGHILPHARFDTGIGGAHTLTAPHVVFVGTVRGHKGLELLRRAIAELAWEGYTLSVTDQAPPDARPWETWVGSTSIEEGLALVRAGDVVVIPSMLHQWSRCQLPAKLIDAMIAGRAIVVSDIPPLVWAIGDGGRRFTPGDKAGLVARLRELSDPTLRSRLGTLARQRALKLFSVDACTQTFEEVCRSALAEQPRASK